MKLINRHNSRFENYPSTSARFNCYLLQVNDNTYLISGNKIPEFQKKTKILREIMLKSRFQNCKHNLKKKLYDPFLLIGFNCLKATAIL